MAAERHGAELVAGKSDISLAAEHEAALSQTAVVHIEAILELKNGFQPTAEVFGAFHAPATALGVAALQFVDLVAANVIGEVEALIDHAVERDRALSHCGNGKHQRYDCCNQSFLH